MSAATLQVPTEAIRELAEVNGVCIRPVVHQVTDTETGKVRLVPTPCGATLASKCPPCARRNRALRMQQCREGWHLDQEPEDSPIDAGHVDEEPPPPVERRVRSTRRRQDAPDLPSLPVENRTVGRAFTSASGRTYRPSMFATFTLPSYGPVLGDGTPVAPATYNYRRAALDALHFPKLIDRLWQNLRRAVGWKVQYFSALEPQRRLAPHLHAAIRGAIPRETVRQVVTATYHQLWWPPHREPKYVGDRLPIWQDAKGYVDPSTGIPLRTWDQALDELDADPAARPAHVLRFGKQLDLQGIIAEQDDADHRVAYLTKYLAKTFGDAYGDDSTATPRQRRHLDRLHHELRYLPCSPRCANWLRFGIQPAGAHDGMSPGQCPAKAHDRQHLGCGGRRVLVSRRWSGKTLAAHRADRVDVVRQVLATAGIEVADAERLAADVRRADGQPRYEWKVWNPLESSLPVYRRILTRTIAERLRWKAEYQAAKEILAAQPP
ncbi:replication initiator [Nocardioides caldifontis]|uniref:replication initiator n=1 Tax=Nocardioides caldifontis TaxID=2588938 RepID=UPI0011DF1E2B|nr:replication initiator [Nocardioides caldifontis]